jgi:endonuclease G
LADRIGYDKDFLPGLTVPVPKPIGDRAADLLTLDDGGGLLHYTHFSLAMSRSRKLAMFTAVNMDGSQSVSIKRTPDKWSYDGRVPLEAQLGEELYEDNDLDRGHLVRREDPNWGTQEEALTANDDTFHFTNCSPQMHAMNAVTWVGLESYILKNARVWQERVTVFTGPVLGVDDLTYRGVRIPIAFWKVLAFLSDSGRPSATAYMVDQENELSTLEAAFGRYKTYQRSIRYVEQVTGLSFGRLKTYDGFSNEEIQIGIPRGRVRVETILESPDDIRV